MFFCGWNKESNIKFKSGGVVPGIKNYEVIDFLPGERIVPKMKKDSNETGNKYLRPIVLKGKVNYVKETNYGYVDVYAVIDAFGVTCPATAHAVKKLLCPGERGSKDTLQDLKESKDSIIRAYEMEVARQNIALGDKRNGPGKGTVT